MHSKIHESFYQVFRLLTSKFPRGGRVRSNDVSLGIFGKCVKNLGGKIGKKSFALFRRIFLPRLFTHFPSWVMHRSKALGHLLGTH